MNFMKTKKILLGGILITVFNLNSYGQLLWKITGNGLNQASYLYGTIHLLPKEKLVISDSIQQALNACSVLALEVDTRFDFKEMVALAQKMRLPDQKTLADYMSPDEFERVKQYCLETVKLKKRKFNQLIQLKPMFLTTFILQKQLGKTDGFEKRLSKLAKKNKMSQMGLETLQAQMEMLDKFPLEEQVSSLLENLGTELEQYNKMLDYYLAADLESLMHLVNEENSINQELAYELLEKRNKNWVYIIPQLISENPYFIAVGAAHLPGDNGVIQLLRNLGYEVNPVL